MRTSSLSRITSLACTEYQDGKGRDKVVFYWVMQPVAGQFEPNQEVDDLRWLTVEESLRLLSYDRDRTLLRALGEHHEE